MNNQVNLSVKDYQIIKNASLSFLPGLNCIIGQSNNGKSALIRAAKSCIYNESGTTSVRNGCSNFAVGMQINGHTVILQKGNNSIYKIDGQTFEKIGRTQLKEVADVLNIKELNLNGSNEQINFWDQMEKPFLLDRTETELFRFIVDSGKDNNVTTALKTLTQDRQELSRNITMIEGKISQVEDTIKNQEEVLKDADKKLAIYNSVIELGPRISNYNSITNLKNRFLEDTRVTQEKQNELSNMNNNLDLLELHINIIDNSKNKYNVITKLNKDIVDKNNNIKNLKNSLESMKSLDISNLNKLVEKYKLLSNIIIKSRSTSSELKELKSIKFPTFSSDFNKNVNNLRKIEELIVNINNKNDLLNKNRDLVKDIKKQIKDITKEINDIGICPTCGQPIHINS